MANDNIYGEIDNKTNLRDVFRQIRKDVETAHKRADLTELHRRAGYLITLSYAPAWKKKFGDELDEIRATAEEEFQTTAHKINRRAEKIGTDADYDDKWGEMKHA